MILPRFGGRAAAPGVLAVLALSCASAPSPTETARRLEKNERATIEGRVVAEDGAAVAGISVYALPHAKDVPSPPPAVTDSAGRFRLRALAPAEYGFLLRWKGRTVVTPRLDDPVHLRVAVAPGEHREGIEIVFLRQAWKDAD